MTPIRLTLYKLEISSGFNELGETIQCKKYQIANLKTILHQLHWSKCHSTTFRGLHDSINDVWWGLKNIWPHIVQQVSECVLTAKSKHSQSHVLDCWARGLTVDKIPARHSVKCHIITRKLLNTFRCQNNNHYWYVTNMKKIYIYIIKKSRDLERKNPFCFGNTQSHKQSWQQLSIIILGTIIRPYAITELQAVLARNKINY